MSRRLSSSLVIALAVCGCDTVIGARRFKDAVVTGTYSERYASNGSGGAPVLTTRVYGPDEIDFDVTLDDGVQPDITYSGSDGTFTFSLERPDQQYEVVTSSDTGVIAYQLAGPSPIIEVRAAGRPGLVPVTQSTPIAFDYGATTTGTATIISTGVYTQTPTSIAGTGNFTFDWLTALPVNGSSTGLLDETQFDRLYIAEMAPFATATVPAVSFIGIRQDAFAAISLADGTPATMTGTLATPALSKCAHVTAFRAEEMARVLAVIPVQPYFTQLTDFTIHATPPTELGPAGEIAIVTSAEVPPGTDVDTQVMYADPFPGTSQLVSLGAYANYNVALPGTTTGVALSNDTRTWTTLSTASANCLDNLATLKGTVGIPQAITLGGATLDTDGVEVALDLTRPVPITWSASSASVQYAIVYVYELAAVGDTTTAALTAEIVSGTNIAGATIHPNVFVPGHTYLVRVENRLGFPNTELGDLGVVHYPIAISGTWSSYFQVGS